MCDSVGNTCACVVASRGSGTGNAQCLEPVDAEEGQRREGERRRSPGEEPDTGGARPPDGVAPADDAHPGGERQDRPDERDRCEQRPRRRAQQRGQDRVVVAERARRLAPTEMAAPPTSNPTAKRVNSSTGAPWGIMGTCVSPRHYADVVDVVVVVFSVVVVVLPDESSLVVGCGVVVDVSLPDSFACSS